VLYKPPPKHTDLYGMAVEKYHFTLKMEAASSSETVVFYACCSKFFSLLLVG